MSTQSSTKNKIKLKSSSPPFFVRLVITSLLMVLVFGISIAISLYSKEVNTPPPTDFAECASAKGSVIQESYPEVCLTKKGLRFVREISSEEKKLLESPSDGGSEGKFCGGIAGFLCPDGYTCKLDGNYPDASGSCIKN